MIKLLYDHTCLVLRQQHLDVQFLMETNESVLLEIIKNSYHGCKEHLSSASLLNDVMENDFFNYLATEEIENTHMHIGKPKHTITTRLSKNRRTKWDYWKLIFPFDYDIIVVDIPSVLDQPFGYHYYLALALSFILNERVRTIQFSGFFYNLDPFHKFLLLWALQFNESVNCIEFNFSCNDNDMNVAMNGVSDNDVLFYLSKVLKDKRTIELHFKNANCLYRHPDTLSILRDCFHRDIKIKIH